MLNYLRAFCERAEGMETGTGPIRFVASTEDVARDGKSLKVADWRLDNYKRNPVVLWVHDYMGRNLPIGRAVNVQAEGQQLVADVEFDQADEFARQVESKYRRGYLNAVSVGWTDVAGQGKQVYHDLMDISAVPVPADPKALKAEEQRAVESVAAELRALVEEIYITDTARAITDQDKAEIKADLKKMPMNDLVATHRRLHQWAAQGHLLTGFSRADMEWFHSATEDELVRRAKEDGREPPEHSPLEWGGTAEVSVDASDDEERWLPGAIGKIKDKLKKKKSADDADVRVESDVSVWDGVASAMLALYRDADAMEDETRHSLYIALERAYRKLDREPPEWRTADELAALGETEIAGLFLEGEARVGAVLSARNRTDLEQAIALIQAVIERASKPEAAPAGEGDEAACDEKKKRAAEEEQLMQRLHSLFVG